MKSRLIFRLSFLISSILVLLVPPLSAQAQQCTSSPIINMPSTYLGCPSDDISPDNTGMATATKGAGNCPDTILVTFVDSIFTNTPCEVLIRRSWTAQYGASTLLPLISTREQIIWLLDTNNPSITNCPADVTIDDTNPIYTWPDPDVSDDCDIDTVYSNFQSGHSFPLGTTLVTYTIEDKCGRFSTCAFVVTVEQCTSDLVLTCPVDYSGCPSDNISIQSLGSAIVSGNNTNCGSVIISYKDTITRNEICNKRIERLWYAEIQGKNISANCTQIIELDDTSLPQILDCPVDITLDISQATYHWEEPKARDDCGILSFTSNYQSGSTFPQGNTTVIYTAKDICGDSVMCSFTITIQNNCIHDYILRCPPRYTGCRSTDTSSMNTGFPTIESSGVLCDSISITYVDQIINNNACRLRFDRIWSAIVPGSGVTKQCVQRINLNNNDAPVLTNCPEDVTISINNADYSWTDPTVVNGCSSATLSASVSKGSTFPIGTTLVTITATDDCGNTSTCSFNVTVENQACTNEFTLICPASYSGCRGDNTSTSNTGFPTIIRQGPLCDSIQFTYTDQILNNTNCRLKFDRIWTATVPGSGIIKKCAQRINLKDIEAPIILNCPPDVTLEFINSAYNWLDPQVSDNCSQVTLSSNYTSGNQFPEGVTEVVYTATDNCGNVSTCSFIVKVESDNNGASLTIECPDNIIVECGSNINFDKWPLPEVNSTCNSCDHDYSTDFLYMGEIDGHRYYCSKYEALWPHANDIARSMGGYLAIINDDFENQLLSNFLTIRSAFIGLSDHHQEGHFKWVNGQPVTYSHWYPGQPNDYRQNQDYVELLHNGYWNDQYNYKKLEFIVEIPCIKIEQTAGPYSPDHFTGNSATIEYTVTDDCGNSATCSFDVSTMGNLNVTCPADIIIDLQSGHSSTHVSWDDPRVQTCCGSSSGDYNNIEIPGYVFMGSRHGHRYYCSKEDATWQNAQNQCESYGGYLAVINDDEENRMLANFLTVQSAYIGLSDHHNESHFRWVNDSPLTYTNWYPRQPNNYNNAQHYVEMLNNGQWNDQYGYKKREYIMEIPGGTEVEQILGPENGSSLEAGIYYVKYKVRDACGNVEICSFKIQVNAAPSYTTCDAGPTDSRNYWIESAQFGNYRNISGNDRGYGNFTNNCFSVKRGEAIEIKLSGGTTNYNAALYWSIFIDWNEDGKYSSSERIAKGISKSALKGYFLFSENLPLGKFKLRISVNPKKYHSNGCDYLPYGEIEDYCIHITGYGSIKEDATGKSAIKQTPVDLIPYELILDEGFQLEDLKKSTLPDISIFPNPFVDKVDITGSSFRKIQVWNINGELVKNIELDEPSAKVRIDLEKLNSGIFLLEIIKEDGSFEIRKIMKR